MGRNDGDGTVLYVGRLVPEPPVLVGLVVDREALAIAEGACQGAVEGAYNVDGVDPEVGCGEGRFEISVVPVVVTQR